MRSPWVTDLAQRGSGFRSLQENLDTTTSSGKLVFHMFGALADFERDLIRERTHAGLTAARARGRFGGRPRGLSRQAEATAVAAETLYREGHLSVQHELSKAVSAPLVVKQRAPAKATTKAEAMRKRLHEQLHDSNNEPVKRGPGRPLKVAASLEQAAWEVAAACHAHQRLVGQRETIGQSLRAIGHTYHVVDLERGVRRNGKLIASDVHHRI